MNKENKIHKKWPTFFGEFYNPNHNEIKNDLIIFFKDYMKNKTTRKGLGENYKLFESEYDLHNYKNPAFIKLLEAPNNSLQKIVEINSGAAIYLSGKVKNLKEGIELAKKTIENKKSKNYFQNLITNQ